MLEVSIPEFSLHVIYIYAIFEVCIVKNYDMVGFIAHNTSSEFAFVISKNPNN